MSAIVNPFHGIRVETTVESFYEGYLRIEIHVQGLNTKYSYQRTLPVSFVDSAFDLIMADMTRLVKEQLKANIEKL